MITLYQYPTCSTCRKARKWLDAAGIDYETVHLVEQTPDADTLRELWEASGLPLRKFFNTSGKLYRERDMKNALGTMDDEEKLTTLAGEGMLIKRPILSYDGGVLVGFKQADWEAAVGA